jgi:excisionase family DNA binding protein
MITNQSSSNSQNSPNRKSEPLLTAAQIAELLNCSDHHVMRMALLGSIPAIDLAPAKSKQRMWRFRKESVLEWLEEKEQGGKRKR